MAEELQTQTKDGTVQKKVMSIASGIHGYNLTDQLFKPLLVDDDGKLVVSSSGGSSTSDLKSYILNDYEVASATLTYLGKEKSDGTWLLVSIDGSTGQFRFANVSNNSSLTTYTTAYAARATLTYDVLENLTGL